MALLPIFPLALASVLFIVWRLLRHFFAKSSLDNIPGPLPSSRVTGSLVDLTDKEGWAYHQGLTDKYGGIIKIKGLFGANDLYISDPKALHYVLIKDQEIYEQTEAFIEFNRMLFGQGIFTAVGERHRLHKKMLNPVFSIAHMRHMVPIFYEVGHRVHKAFSEKARYDWAEVDIIDWMTRVALELIGQSGLGFSFDSLAERGVPHEYARASKKLVPLASGSSPLGREIALKICRIGTPRFRRFLVDIMPFEIIKGLKDIVDTLHQTSVHIVSTKKKALEAGDAATSAQIDEGKDIMSILIKRNMLAADEDKLTDAELLGLVTSLTFAATDTTSGALRRTLHLLAQNPDVQARLREELRHARKNSGGDDLDYDVLVSLPFLDAVCRETLRLYPPLSVAERTTRQDVSLPLGTPIKGVDGTDIGSIQIPKGTHIHVSIIQTNRNPELWGPDVLEWRPDRWLNPLPQALIDAHVPGVYSHLLTFLGGGRSCLGFKFSQLEMKVILALLVEDLEFALGEKDIYWQMNVISTPNTDRKGMVPTMPMKIRVAAPSS